MVETRASVEQNCATRQQPQLLEPRQHQQDLRLLQERRREIQLAQVETCDGVSLDEEKEYTFATTEHLVCPQSVQVDNHVSPACWRNSCRWSDSSETENASLVDAFATGDLESSWPPKASSSTLQSLDCRPFWQTISGVPHLSSDQDGDLKQTGGSKEVEGLSACTNCATQQHNGTRVTEDQHSRGLDRSGEVSCCCKNLNDGHSRDHRSGRSNSREGGIGKKGRLNACNLLLLSHASRYFPSRKRRSPPICILHSLSTRDTLEEQQKKNITLQQVSSNTLYQQYSLSLSLEHDPENVDIKNRGSSRRQQQAQYASRAQQSQQLIPEQVTSPCCHSAAILHQPCVCPKQDGSASWRTGGAGSLTETNSLSGINDDASNAVFLQCSILESKQRERTGTTAAPGGSYRNYFWKRFRAEEAAAVNRTVAELGRRKEAEQTSPVASGEKRGETHSSDEAPPAPVVSQHATSGTPCAQPFFSHLVFRRFSLTRQAATAQQERRGFARSTSTVTQIGRRVLSKRAGATRSVTGGLPSIAAAQATRAGLYFHAQNSPAGTNFQLHPTLADNHHSSTSSQERSPKSCLFCSSSKADETLAAKATSARAAYVASRLASENARTEEQREGEDSLQGGKEQVSSVGEKWQSIRALAALEKEESGDGIGSGQTEVSDAPNEDARFHSRKAPEHNIRHRLFQMRSRKCTLIRVFSSGNRQRNVADDGKQCEASRTKKATFTGGGIECTRVEAQAKSNSATAVEEKVSPGECNGLALRKRAATIFASVRSSSLHDIAAAVGGAARESGSRSAGARLKEAEGGRRAEGDRMGREAAGEEGEAVGSKREPQRGRAVDACRLHQTLENPEYASYLQWHEEKWDEKVFDQIEVADVDIFNHPLRRGLGCVITVFLSQRRDKQESQHTAEEACSYLRQH